MYCKLKVQRHINIRKEILMFFTVHGTRTYFLDRISILKPPALKIAAEEPVGVDIHIPLDHTLNENN
jgi:hypothetical protein